jgi:hypothetical protein
VTPIAAVMAQIAHIGISVLLDRSPHLVDMRVPLGDPIDVLPVSVNPPPWAQSESPGFGVQGIGVG